jgi:predicted nuclease of predicted toxin-antitoxin system
MTMKLLLDEQMPRKIATYFDTGAAVDHVQLVGWAGIKNGELLKLANVCRQKHVISTECKYASNISRGTSRVTTQD